MQDALGGRQWGAYIEDLGLPVPEQLDRSSDVHSAICIYHVRLGVDDARKVQENSRELRYLIQFALNPQPETATPRNLSP